MTSLIAAKTIEKAVKDHYDNCKVVFGSCREILVGMVIRVTPGL